jgi:hypothetical protein
VLWSVAAADKFVLNAKKAYALLAARILIFNIDAFSTKILAQANKLARAFPQITMDCH